ncbi:MAG: hypothetical protein ACK40L_02010 [Hydrogenophaga sp.]
MMERDPVEEHRRQQEDEEFWREKEEALAVARGDGPRPPQSTSSEPQSGGSSTFKAAALSSIRSAGKSLKRPPLESTPGIQPSGIPMPKGMGVAVAVVVAVAALGWAGMRFALSEDSKADAQSQLAMPELASATAAPLADPALPATLAASAQTVASDALTLIKSLLAEETASRETGDAALAEQLAALNARLDVMERRMSDVVGGLKANGYLKAEAELVGALKPEDFVAHPGSVKRAAAPSSDRPASTQAQASTSRRAARPAPAPTLPGQQLLSVDLWNGRPSVVMGNGNPASPEVKVLEPGDSINGITLLSVDMTSGRATFVNARNQTVTLQVAGQP